MPHTPYFVYSKKEPPERFEFNPHILRVFVRPCSLCGAKDPFGYIERYLLTDFTEQDAPHNLERILADGPPRVPSAKPKISMPQEVPAEILDAINNSAKQRKKLGAAAEQSKLIGSENIPHIPNDRVFKPHPNGRDGTCLKCDRQQLKMHKFCVSCGVDFRA